MTKLPGYNSNQLGTPRPLAATYLVRRWKHLVCESGCRLEKGPEPEDSIDCHLNATRI